MYMMLKGFWLGQEYVNCNGVIRNQCHLLTPDKSIYFGNLLLPINFPFGPNNPPLNNLMEDYGQLIGTIPVRSTRNSRIK